MLRKLQDIVITALLRSFALLPLSLVRALGSMTGFLLQNVFRYRVKVVSENLSRCFPKKSPEWIHEITSTYFRHLGRIMAEVIKIPGINEPELRQLVQIKGWDIIAKAKQESRPVLLMCGHTGNWELAALRFGIETDGVVVVYKPLKDNYFDGWYYRLRSRFGVQPVPVRQAGRLAINTRGFSLNCFVADQTPSDMNSGYWLNFLGRPTLFFDGFAKIARRMKAVVVYANMVSHDDSYVIEITEVVPDAAHYEPEFIVTQFVKLLEQDIVRVPWNWLWSHKRWKRQPPVLS